MEIIKGSGLADFHCSTCKFADGIVAFTTIGNVEKNGSVTTQSTVEPTPVGQVRSCGSWFTRLLGRKTFVHPKEDDSCVNDRYQPKKKS